MLVSMNNATRNRGNQWNPQPLEEKFWAKVDKRGPDECWPWLAPLDRGYGKMSTKVDGRWRTVKAHRVSYEIHFGEVPDGAVLDHVCHDPRTCDGGENCPHRSCVNPTHVQPVGNGVNNSAERMSVYRPSSETHCKRNHEFTPENTGTQSNSFRYCKKCKSNRERSYRAARKKGPSDN